MARRPKRAEGAAPYRAGEALAVLLEGGGIERLAIVAGQAELGGAQATFADAQAQPLNDEGRLVGKPAVGLEPVALALADGEPAPLGRAREGEQEEAERRRIHDLRALVVDPAFAIHSVVILACHLLHARLSAISSSAGSEPSEASCPAALPRARPRGRGWARAGRRWRRHSSAGPGFPT